MGGVCPSRVPPTPFVGGWYRDGRKWVHVEVNVVITDTAEGGLRGSGTMQEAGVMVVHFDHHQDRLVRGVIQPNGDINWANGKAWSKYTGQWRSPVPASESQSPSSASDSLIAVAPAELAPQEAHANLELALQEPPANLELAPQGPPEPHANLELAPQEPQET